MGSPVFWPSFVRQILIPSEEHITWKWQLSFPNRVVSIHLHVIVFGVHPRESRIYAPRRLVKQGEKAGKVHSHSLPNP